MKMLLYEIKFLVPNYSCLQNPWLRDYRPQIPVLSVLCPQLNLLNPPPRKKFLGTPLPSEEDCTRSPASPSEICSWQSGNGTDIFLRGFQPSIINTCHKQMILSNSRSLSVSHTRTRSRCFEDYTVIPRLTKIIRSGITFVSRNLR